MAGLIKQLDQRLDALKTDYVDLIFIHAVGDHDFATEWEWPKSKEFKETAEAIRKSGKAKFVAPDPPPKPSRDSPGGG